MLIHSSVSANRQWRALTETLKNRYRVLAINLFGYGETRVRPVKWWKLASALFRFVSVVEIGHGRRIRMSSWLG
ncbi:MAG TPA: hypothetical protein VKW76_01130 [Candidatus Binatia bacterium]|nr:hypothetical protein [Candidatus Binatia bacterium]